MAQGASGGGRAGLAGLHGGAGVQREKEREVKGIRAGLEKQPHKRLCGECNVMLEVRMYEGECRVSSYSYSFVVGVDRAK